MLKEMNVSEIRDASRQNPSDAIGVAQQDVWCGKGELFDYFLGHPLMTTQYNSNISNRTLH